MTKTERLKAHHLNLCRFLRDSWEERFCHNMAWCAEHAASKPLTPRQKYALDMVVYRFRRQLAGRLPDELMLDTLPIKSDYGVQEKVETVNDLFTGEASPPHPTETGPADRGPQSKLI